MIYMFSALASTKQYTILFQSKFLVFFSGLSGESSVFVSWKREEKARMAKIWEFLYLFSPRLNLLELETSHAAQITFFFCLKLHGITYSLGLSLCFGAWRRRQEGEHEKRHTQQQLNSSPFRLAHEYAHCSRCSFLNFYCNKLWYLSSEVSSKFKHIFVASVCIRQTYHHSYFE